jgi:hypothetical protein
VFCPLACQQLPADWLCKIPSHYHFRLYRQSLLEKLFSSGVAPQVLVAMPIQLATAAGYEVIATASPRNHDYLKKLGAVNVFDYRSPTVVRDIISAFKNGTTAGAFAVGRGSLKNRQITRMPHQLNFITRMPHNLYTNYSHATPLLALTLRT